MFGNKLFTNKIFKSTAIDFVQSCLLIVGYGDSCVLCSLHIVVVVFYDHSLGGSPSTFLSVEIKRQWVIMIGLRVLALALFYTIKIKRYVLRNLVKCKTPPAQRSPIQNGTCAEHLLLNFASMTFAIFCFTIFDSSASVD